MKLAWWWLNTAIAHSNLWMRWMHILAAYLGQETNLRMKNWENVVLPRSIQTHLAVNFPFGVLLLWCTSDARIPQGFELDVSKELWDQRSRTGVLWSSNPAATGLWGVVCLANSFECDSNWLALASLCGKDVIFRPRAREENTPAPHVSKQGLDSYFYARFISCSDWSPLQGCGWNLSRNTAFVQRGLVQGCSVGWRRSNGYEAVKTCLLAGRSVRYWHDRPAPMICGKTFLNAGEEWDF